MFDGHGTLVMEGDHLDVSYRDLDPWLSYTPSGSIRSVAFHCGDPTCGPSVLLGACAKVDGEDLDWKHTIDPMHYHGSDQFRLLMGGRWVVARQPLERAEFCFQESGRVYQEHPGDGPIAWPFLVYGDRRGEPATLTLEEDRVRLMANEEIYGSPVAADSDYAHPAGRKGIPAIATTEGELGHGFIKDSFENAASWRALGARTQAVAGVWGDQEAGPVVYLIHSGAGEVIVPASRFSTELVLVVANGSCRTGDAEYLAGDLRVQRADSPLGAVLSGPDGTDLALMVADRRATVSLTDPADETALTWKRGVDDLLAQLLAAVPG